MINYTSYRSLGFTPLNRYTYRQYKWNNIRWLSSLNRRSMKDSWIWKNAQCLFNPFYPHLQHQFYGQCWPNHHRFRRSQLPRVRREASCWLWSWDSAMNLVFIWSLVNWRRRCFEFPWIVDHFRAPDQSQLSSLKRWYSSPLLVVSWWESQDILKLFVQFFL